MFKGRNLLALLAIIGVSLVALGCGQKNDEQFSTAPPTDDSKFSKDQSGSSADATSATE